MRTERPTFQALNPELFEGNPLQQYSKVVFLLMLRRKIIRKHSLQLNQVCLWECQWSYQLHWLLAWREEDTSFQYLLQRDFHRTRFEESQIVGSEENKGVGTYQKGNS